MDYLDNIKDKKQTQEVKKSQQALTDLSQEIRTLLKSLEKTGANKLDEDFVNAVAVLSKVATSLKRIQVTSDDDIKTGLRALLTAVSALEVNPVVNVQPAKVQVQEREIDFKPVIDALKKLNLKSEVNVDLDELAKGIVDVKDAIKNLKFPASNFILPFVDSEGRSTQVQLDSNGNVPTSGSGGGGGDVNITEVGGNAVTTTVPVSGTVTANLGTLNGAATAANQQTDALTDTELRATPVVVDLGANNDVTVTSGSITVANASIPVTDNGGSLTVDGTVGITANSSVNVAQMNGVATTMGNGASGAGVQRVTIASDSTGVIIARGAAATDAVVSGNPVYVGSRASAAEPTSMSADNDAVPFWLDRKGRQVVTMQAATTAVTQVAGSATSVTLKASNTSRKGLTITNDSTADLYVKLGATASTTSYTIKLKTDDYYEVPYGYTGVVDGIWSSATGNAYVTEVS